MALTSEEQKELVRLMKKATFPAPKAVFDAWCEYFSIVTCEIGLISHEEGNPNIFLSYRDDEHFKGWHIPGSVVLPGQNIRTTLMRVIEKEIKHSITGPRFEAWFERPKGTGIGESSRGQELSLFFFSEPNETIKETATEKMFPLDHLPDDLLIVHIPLIEAVRKIVPAG